LEMANRSDTSAHGDDNDERVDSDVAAGSTDSA
jgi:hypothetical protein